MFYLNKWLQPLKAIIKNNKMVKNTQTSTQAKNSPSNKSPSPKPSPAKTKTLCQVQRLKDVATLLGGKTVEETKVAYKNQTSYLVAFNDTSLKLRHEGKWIYEEENTAEPGDEHEIFKIVYIKSLNLYLISYYDYLAIKMIDGNPPQKVLNFKLSGAENCIQTIPNIPYRVLLLHENGKIAIANLRTRRIEHVCSFGAGSRKDHWILNLWIHKDFNEAPELNSVIQGSEMSRDGAKLVNSDLIVSIIDSESVLKTFSLFGRKIIQWTRLEQFCRRRNCYEFQIN